MTNIVQTFWTKPIRVKTDQNISKALNAGWLEYKFHLMSWMLSCLKLKQYYPQLRLITDSYGKELLIDVLGLPYDQVSTALDALEKYHPGIWALSKIYSYGQQEAPFFHVDSDVFIWNAFDFGPAELVAQNLDCNHPTYLRALEALKSVEVMFPDYVQPYLDQPQIFAANAGVIGGTNVDFFQRFADSVFDFIDLNQDKLQQMQHIEYSNIIFEQFFYWCFAQSEGLPIAFLNNKIEYGEPPEHYVRFWGIPEKTNYIHMIYNYKTNRSLLEYLEHRLKIEFPAAYYKIYRILEEFQL